MKTLYLVRHAKSSWKDKSLEDLQRPLNKRGKRDAPFMAALLAKTISNVDLVMCSHARRAYDTARIFAKALSYPEKNIQIDKGIYEAEFKQLVRLLTRLDNQIENAICVGHNPSITQLSNYLTTDDIANVPTSGIVEIELQTSSWESLENCDAKLKSFHYPEKYLSLD